MIDKMRYSSADFFRDAKPMLRGMTRVASAVKEAYGPKGEPVVIRPEAGKTRYTKRGYLIIDALTPGDRIEARGAHMLKLAAEHTTDRSGDGSATAAIIGEAILQEGESAIATGTDPFDLENGIERAVHAAMRHLKQQARRRLTPQQIACVGMIAADNDPEIRDALGRIVVAGEDPLEIHVIEGGEPGVAIDDAHTLRIGPGGGVDLEERLSRAMTALHSLHHALEGGVVAGGGAALLHAADALGKLKPASRGERAGIDIVRRALQAPAKQLAMTAGTDPERIARAVMEKHDFGFGYDVVSGQLTDMYDVGIIDPLRVVSAALDQAGKIGCAYVTVPAVLGSGARKVNSFLRRNRDFAGVFPEMFGGSQESEGRSAPDASGRDKVIGRAGGDGGGIDERTIEDGKPEPEPERRQRPVRHLVGNFPERLRKESVAELTVRVSLTEVAGRSKALELGEIPPEGIALNISVIAPAFEIEGAATALLLVPPAGDSALVGFRLKAVKEGPAQIHVSAFHGGTKVGDLALEAMIDAGELDGTPPPSTVRRREVGSLAQRPGEASLLLSFHEPTETYSFQWGDEQGWKPTAYTKKKFAELNDVVKEAAKKIEEIVRLDYDTQAEVAKHQLRTRGIDLWEQLIPPEIRDHFIARHGQINRISIYSGGDPFPWEMLYPFRKEPRFDGDRFLIEQVEICRWVHGSLPPTIIPVCRADFVVADRADLAKADSEIAKVTDLLKQWDAALQEKRIEEAKELYDLFKQKIVSLLHFACHQSFDDDIERIMVKNTPVAPNDFIDAQLLVEAAPFIFMNACRSDRKVPGYTKIGGWARSFLSAGAGAFIGTLWEVRDETAKVFAETLYEELLLADKSFGEALRSARLAVQEKAPGDPTWLAYSFYGDADARVKKNHG